MIDTRWQVMVHAQGLVNSAPAQLSLCNTYEQARADVRNWLRRAPVGAAAYVTREMSGLVSLSYQNRTPGPRYNHPSVTASPADSESWKAPFDGCKSCGDESFGDTYCNGCQIDNALDAQEQGWVF